MSGSISSLYGAILTGDSRISDDYKNTFKDGKKDYRAGGELTREGLDGMRDDLAGYTDLLRSDSVLSEGTHRAFRLGQGAITDRSTRSRRAFLASMAQIARQQGGALTATQQADMQRELERDLTEQEIDAERGLTIEKSQLELSETNRLRDRVQTIRSTFVGVGQSERDRAASMMLQALFGRHRYMKDADESAQKWTMGAGGGGLTANG